MSPGGLMTMNKEIVYKDLGKIPYAEAWEYQEELFRKIIGGKDGQGNNPIPNYLLFCEHPHVFTLGKSGSDQNLLINEQVLKSKGATFFRTNRGGDITYHGPGQIVGYPILDLEQFNLGIRKYIEILEEAVMILLKEYNIVSTRLEGASGVWLDADTPQQARKICAIGVRSSRFVTMHGFAFNVNTDLGFYNYINPCGFTDKGVTSMAKELGKRQDMADIKSALKSILIDLITGN
ncbi:MAG: lipoyl(octanoyl) transferase LipB [Bacteroidota bacterium]